MNAEAPGFHFILFQLSSVYFLSLCTHLKKQSAWKKPGKEFKEYSLT